MKGGRRPFQIALAEGEVLRGDVWTPTSPSPDAAIVVCHGFKGFKDWGFFPYLCEELARRTDCLTVGFNFTGSGVEERLEEFTALERFGRNTFSRELEDLEIVLDGLTVGRLGDVRVPEARRFGLMGHSRGGATALLKASRRRQVQALVTWAAVASLGRYLELYAGRWEAGEPVFIENARTGQQMPLYRNVMDDLRANAERLDVQRAAAHLDIPYLIVHGSEDESVPLADGERLAMAAPEATLERIEGAGHTMGAGHPFVGPNPHLERAIAVSATHLRAVLTEGES
jgi:pimeloyl-ACP methyl ester carboxylesterase